MTLSGAVIQSMVSNGLKNTHSIGEHYLAPLNSYWATGPDGGGYYRELPGGGYEKLLDGFGDY